MTETGAVIGWSVTFWFQKTAAREIVNVLVLEEVTIRSVFTCNTRHGVQLSLLRYQLGDQTVEAGSAVETIAAQRSGTWHSLQCVLFHTGGVASNTDITQGLPCVQEIF